MFSGNWVKTRGWVTTFNSVSAFQDPSYFSHSLKSSLFCFRCIEWMDCCCAGTENNQNGGEELLLPFSQVIPCRDTICPHPRASSCELLAQLPCSVPLNSGYSIDIYHLHVPPFSPSLFLSVVLCWTGFIYRHCYQMNPSGYSSPMARIQPHWMWVAFAGKIVPHY